MSDFSAGIFVGVVFTLWFVIAVLMVAYYSNDEFETDGVCNQCYGGGFRVQCPHTDRPRFKVKER